MHKLVLSLLSFLFFSGYTNADEHFSHSIINIPYEYQVEEPWMMVLNSQEDMEEFFQLIISVYEDYDWVDTSWIKFESMPVVDFDKYTLVVGGLGYQSSGGEELAIGRIAGTSETLYIMAYHISYVGCASTAAAHYPTIGILVEKTDRNIVASLDNAVYQCEY